MTTAENDTDACLSADAEETSLLLEATKGALAALGIRGTLHAKICKLVLHDASMTHDVLARLETARQRMRGRLEHRVDIRLHELAPQQTGKIQAVSWRKG